VPLDVPPHFNRNGPDVQALAPAADTGLWLLQYMCRRIGLTDLSGSDVLDYGCGSRFAETIINRELPIRSYTGVDVHRPMIDFLRANAIDPRLTFEHMNARNPFYNPDGEPLSRRSALPVGDRTFDIACMFSVITHQVPADAESIFAMLRRYVRAGGHLFFSASIEDGDFGYREMYPQEPTRYSVYTPRLMVDILQRSGWRVLSQAPRNDQDLPILESFVCAPLGA